jgi:protein phosphatase 1 regulatory subunit 12A
MGAAISSLKSRFVRELNVNLRNLHISSAAVMADEKQQTSAIFKRHEQLKRWEDSDTNKCLNHTLGKDKKVKFQDGCVFLAACSSGDTEEVKRLLDRGADINTANIDGLTALHQV